MSAREETPAELQLGRWMEAAQRGDAAAYETRREIALDDAPEPVAPELAAGPEAAIDPALADAMRALPDAQREAVEMVHLEELSMAEAAARAGVGVEALWGHACVPVVTALLAFGAGSALRLLRSR